MRFRLPTFLPPPRSLLASAALVLAGASGLARAEDAPRILPMPEIRALDSRALGERVVARLGRELPRAPGPGIADRAELILFAPEGAIASIAEHGFLNQHQTRTTEGRKVERDRFAREQEFARLRLPFSDKVRDLLPKYAALSVRDASLGSYGLLTWYGGVAFVFKREVHGRVTWTTDDSLDSGLQPRPLAHGPAPGEHCHPSRYCEAQIWGALDLSDVAYAMIAEGREVPAALRETGLPVRYFRVAPNPRRTIQIVDAGEAQPRAREPGRARRLSPAELEARLAELSWQDKLPRNILTERLRGQRTSAELIAEIAATPHDITAPYTQEIDARSRLYGELATRKKSPAVTRALLAGLADPDGLVRAQCELGLSERAR